MSLAVLKWVVCLVGLGLVVIGPAPLLGTGLLALGVLLAAAQLVWHAVGFVSSRLDELDDMERAHSPVDGQAVHG